MKGNAFIRQYASKYESGVQAQLKKKGYIDQTTVRESGDIESFTNDDINSTFAEQLSAQFKINRLTKNFKEGCSECHPDKESWNPRYYNYLRSSSKLKEFPVPSLMLNPDKSLMKSFDSPARRSLIGNN